MMSVVFKRTSGEKEKTENSILQILAYFSIFQYPLSKDEIINFLHPDADSTRLDYALESLVTEGSIFKINGFYLLKNDISLVARRKEGNLRAEQLLPKAMKIGRFLSKFPYVRGVGISGSLSKKFADEKADIDFFIVTRANRLWIARTCMHLFKKLTFLAGKQHYFCMNYYVDEKALMLKERNIYTAVETFTLLPVNGTGLDDFFAANSWVSEWFANFPVKRNDQPRQSSSSVVKKMIEWVFNNKAGNWLDNYLMKVTDRRWQKKKRNKALNRAGREMDLITGKHFAMSNPGMFREKVLAIYDEKITGVKCSPPGYFENTYPNSASI
ncbi:MAG: hypothetical protein Q8941_19655 [Bacteroidota bacterium]|nr:hypothetical protein [Bacteroidota bacterium]